MSAQVPALVRVTTSILLPATASAATPPALGSGAFSKEDDMPQLEFTAPAPQPLTTAEIAANFPDLPDGWTAKDDLALVEGLFKLVGLARIALSIGKTFDATQARFLQLRKAASPNPRYPFSLTAQSRLLEVVRGRAG